ncbi:MAG TPA: hypothetical protein VFX16_01930 [Pseudonocardiaceae bacterium]|nr:hypothetical protein [Pseudonocardiaceae bacterium]
MGLALRLVSGVTTERGHRPAVEAVASLPVLPRRCAPRPPQLRTLGGYSPDKARQCLLDGLSVSGLLCCAFNICATDWSRRATMEPERKSGRPSRRNHGRRTVLKAGAVGGAAAVMAMLDEFAWSPLRPAMAATAPPDIQFDLSSYIAPATSVDGVAVQFGPVFTLFQCIDLKRMPTKAEQTILANALATIETAYPFSPAGVMMIISYGMGYFSWLPGALGAGSVAFNNIPRLALNNARFVLEEAVPAPTDAGQPGIVKRKFDITPQLGGTDMLITVRSDVRANAADVLNWLRGSGTLAGVATPSPKLPWIFTERRVQFAQQGMPRLMAEEDDLYYQDRINPESPMWMGFGDQQVNASGPAQAVSFAGNASSHLSTAQPGSYFDNGAIQNLSHVIMDLEAYYARAGEAGAIEDETYLERVQYMFRSNPPPSLGNGSDPFLNGGGPSFLPNDFRGINDASQNAQGIDTLNNAHRIGHVSALQRFSRAADGTPLHIRMDGPGFDKMDIPSILVVPGTSGNVPKLQFTIFVPTADFLNTVRTDQASLDLQAAFAVNPLDNGLERFLTATRRQNFICPPRRNRAFPLLELT